MEPIPFAIVGTGWRAAFYERVATALPDRFRITGTLSRSATGSRATIDELLADEPAFVVLSVPWGPMPALIAELADRGAAVLAETPPAPDLDGLRSLRRLAGAGGRIQVAEQYRYQPLHAARLAIVASGRLGTISQVQLSVAHGYHGIDLLRRFLGVAAEPVTITARRVFSPIVAGPDRAGPPADERIVQADQTIATFAFGKGAAEGGDATADRLGILDFTDEQYFSWIRGPRLLVRGERGEIDGTVVRWLADARTPLRVTLERHDTGQDGNLEGHYLTGITAGADVCSLADAVQDRYLDILVAEAAATGRPAHADGHLWDGG